MICIECKHGHDCPYVKGEADLFHVLLMAGYKDEDLVARKKKVLQELKELVIREYGVTCEFDLGVVVTQCEGDWGWEQNWGDLSNE